MGLILVLSIGFVAGIVSGIIGTGSAIILVPVLTYIYGPKQAIPIMAVASILANASRVAAWWRELDWRPAAAYAGTAVPAAALGARTMLALPPRAVDVAIGAFLLLTIPARSWMARNLAGLRLSHLAMAGAVIGFLTGIVASTGPADVPFFLAYGLTKGAFLGTEAAAALAVYMSKLLTFRSAGALPTEESLKGLAVGGSLMAGAFIAKPMVLRLEPATFRHVMDGLLLVAGSCLLWKALSG